MASSDSKHFYAERDRRIAQVAESLGRLTSATSALNRNIEGESFLQAPRSQHSSQMVSYSFCSHWAELWQCLEPVVSL